MQGALGMQGRHKALAVPLFPGTSGLLRRFTHSPFLSKYGQVQYKYWYTVLFSLSFLKIDFGQRPSFVTSKASYSGSGYLPGSTMGKGEKSKQLRVLKIFHP